MLREREEHMLYGKEAKVPWDMLLLIQRFEIKRSQNIPRRSCDIR